MKLENEKEYKVSLYYTTFCTHTVKAIDEEQAIMKAREIPLLNEELQANLQNWCEADTAQEIENE